MGNDTTKTCKGCGEEKPLSEFYQRKSGRIDTRCKECQKEYYRRYREENREKIAERHRRYRKRNPEKTRVYSLNRRSRKRKAKGAHTSQDIKSLYEGQAGKCWYCACDVGDDFHVDHFIPLSKGGSNDVGNLRIACPTCNLSKNASHPHDWDGRLL